MATNSVYANYQEIVDISTTPQKVGIFGIHTPDTVKPVQMLNGFYRQFRQVKYLGCDVKIQPAATLPMDPLGVSYEAGEVATDPRDLLNPIMVKGAHGETLNQALDVAYRDNNNIGDSLTKTEYNHDPTDGESVIYYTALSDPTFRKYSVLQPFGLRALHPLVHKIVGTMPIYPKQTKQGYIASLEYTKDDDSGVDYNDNGFISEDGSQQFVRSGVGSWPDNYNDNVLNGQVFTSRMEKLGWLDTYSRPASSTYSGISGVPYDMEDIRFNTPLSEQYGNGAIDFNTDQYRFNLLPRLFMSVMIMPPCYKTILSFRMVINHKFAFRGFTSAKSPSLATEAYYIEPDPISNAVSATSIDAVNGTSSLVTEGVY